MPPFHTGGMRSSLSSPCFVSAAPHARRYFVSRHPGAIEWAKRYPWGLQSEFVAHLDPSLVMPGDVVIGSLPVHLVAELCARGACYLHLVLPLAAELRGKELSADELEALGAHLHPYRAERLGGSPATPRGEES